MEELLQQTLQQLLEQYGAIVIFNKRTRSNFKLQRRNAKTVFNDNYNIRHLHTCGKIKKQQCFYMKKLHKQTYGRDITLNDPNQSVCEQMQQNIALMQQDIKQLQYKNGEILRKCEQLQQYSDECSKDNKTLLTQFITNVTDKQCKTIDELPE